MGQESIGIDNLKVENKEKRKKKVKEDISLENKMQIRKFLDFLEYEKGSSRSTANGYNRDLVQFFLFSEKNYNEIEEQDVFGYIEYISGKLKKNSVLSKVSAIKAFYKFCYLNKAVEKDLKVEENAEVKKNNEEMMEGQKEQKKKIKKDISRENKMQIREFLDFLE